MSGGFRPLISLLDEILSNYAVDSRRVYLTGLSMGGRGAWQLAASNPKRFAAIVPVCGRAPDVPGFFESLSSLKDVSVWGARKIVAVLRNLGLTIYPEAAHDSWTFTCANPRTLFVAVGPYPLTGAVADQVAGRLLFLVALVAEIVLQLFGQVVA